MENKYTGGFNPFAGGVNRKVALVLTITDEYRKMPSPGSGTFVVIPGGTNNGPSLPSPTSSAVAAGKYERKTKDVMAASTGVFISLEECSVFMARRTVENW